MQSTSLILGFTLEILKTSIPEQFSHSSTSPLFFHNEKASECKVLGELTTSYATYKRNWCSISQCTCNQALLNVSSRSNARTPLPCTRIHDRVPLRLKKIHTNNRFWLSEFKYTWLHSHGLGPTIGDLAICLCPFHTYWGSRHRECTDNRCETHHKSIAKIRDETGTDLWVTPSWPQIRVPLILA